MMPTAVCHRVIEIAGAPISRQRRIEHVAEPMDDHGLADLRENAIIDFGVVVGIASKLRQCARRHQDDAAADFLDCRDLLLIGADHIVDALRVFDRQMIGAGAGKYQCVARLRRAHRARDQFQRGRPVQPHAALRGVHRLGHAEPEVPDMLAKRDGPVPIDRRRQPGIDVGQRIGDDVCRGEGNAVERALELCGECSRRREAIGLDAAVGLGQAQRQRRHRQHGLVHGCELLRSARSAPSPRPSRGEGWGEGLIPRQRCE